MGAGGSAHRWGGGGPGTEEERGGGKREGMLSYNYAHTCIYVTVGEHPCYKRW